MIESRRELTIGTSRQMYTLRTLVALLRQPTLALRYILAERSFQGAISHSIVEQNKKRPLLWRNLQGYKILLDCRKQTFAAWIATTGMYELETSIVFGLLAKNGQTIVDIGAGVGWFTLLGAMVARPRGRILALEPDPSNIFLIRKSVQANNMSNIQIIEACVSNVDGEAYLNLASDAGYNSMKRMGDKGRLLCACIRVDSLIERENIDMIDLMKIDVEGAEPEVLEGAMQSLLKFRILNIITEWNPEVWKDREDLLQLLFKVYNCSKIRQTRFLSRVDLRKILTPMGPDEIFGYHGNVLFSRKKQDTSAPEEKPSEAEHKHEVHEMRPAC